MIHNQIKNIKKHFYTIKSNSTQSAIFLATRRPKAFLAGGCAGEGRRRAPTEIVSIHTVSWANIDIPTKESPERKRRKKCFT